MSPEVSELCRLVEPQRLWVIKTVLRDGRGEGVIVVFVSLPARSVRAFMKRFRNAACGATVYGYQAFDLSCEKYVLTRIAGNLTTSFLSVGQKH